MTMVPAPKLSKPHLVFYRGCGGGGGRGGRGGASDVMSRFGDGGYNNINSDAGATNNIITNNTRVSAPMNGANSINKVDTTNGSCCVLGSDLGVIGHHLNTNTNTNTNTNYSSYHNIVHMADEEEEQSRTSNTSVNDDGADLQHPAAAAAAAPTSIKRQNDTPATAPPSYQDHHHHRGGMVDSSSSSWLQLGLGAGTHIRSPSQQQQQQQQQHPAQAAQLGGGSSGLMLELNLGGGGGSGGSEMIPQTTSLLMPPELESRNIPHRPLDYPTSTSFFGVAGGGGGAAGGFITPHHPAFIPLIPSLSQQSQPYLHHHPQHILSLSDHYHQQQQQHQQQIGWGYINQTTALSTSPSSSSSIPVQGGAGSFLTRPFTTSGSSADAADSEFRLIHPPPRRPHSGIWFALHASNHQLKELCLPQVPKSFLRIKDGRMTVRLVMKYVANKLGLDNESEVEIRCRGQQLVPYLTLQHVRDNIWSPREAVSVTLLPESSTSDHVMVLNYGRSTNSSSYLPTST